MASLWISLLIETGAKHPDVVASFLSVPPTLVRVRGDRPFGPSAAAMPINLWRRDWSTVLHEEDAIDEAQVFIDAVCEELTEGKSKDIALPKDWAVLLKLTIEQSEAWNVYLKLSPHTLQLIASLGLDFEFCFISSLNDVSDEG